MSFMLASGEEVVLLTTFKQRLYQGKGCDCHAEPCRVGVRTCRCRLVRGEVWFRWHWICPIT